LHGDHFTGKPGKVENSESVREISGKVVSGWFGGLLDKVVVAPSGFKHVVLA